MTAKKDMIEASSWTNAMKKSINDFLYRYIFPEIGFVLVKLLSATCRNIVIEPRNKIPQPIYISWHQRFFPGIVFLAREKPIAIMISESRDGELISRIVDRMGWHSVRGSSTRGGIKALLKLKRLVQQGYKVGHIVDGPTGPFAVVKSGLIYMAQITGLPVVPLIFSPEKKWILKSWDRFMIPKPFTRIIYRYGDPIYVPEEIDASEFEEKRLFVEKTLDTLYRETDALWEHPQTISTFKEK